MKIIVLYDNEALHPSTYPAHGFSALVELEEFHILFDTGWNGVILLRNIEKLNITLDKVKYIFLSHQHWDHIGGIPEVLEKVRNRVSFVIPASFTRGFKSELAKHGELIEISDHITEFYPGVFSTGEMQSDIGIKEHALFIEKGRVLIVGCSHPDVYNMVKRFGSVNTLIGGFHGFSELKKLEGVVRERIYPCHCTVKKKEILNLYPEKARKCGIGLEVAL